MFVVFLNEGLTKNMISACFRYLSIICLINLINTQQTKDAAYLMHYWPIENRQMTDIMGNAHMIQGSNVAYTADRYGNPDSTLALNDGWTQVDANFYFSATQFTLSAWVYPKDIKFSASLLEFDYAIQLALSSDSNLKPFFKINNELNCSTLVESNVALVNEEWQMLTATFDGSIMSIYINSTLTANATLNCTWSEIVRTNCVIGKSVLNNGTSKSYVDDIRLFNVSLTPIQIQDLMTNNNASVELTRMAESITTTDISTHVVNTAKSSLCIGKLKKKLAIFVAKTNF